MIGPGPGPPYNGAAATTASAGPGRSRSARRALEPVAVTGRRAPSTGFGFGRSGRREPYGHPEPGTAGGTRRKAVSTAGPAVTTGADIECESIAALEPDLIVGVDVPYLAKTYRKLSAVAPTAVTSFSDGASWSTYPGATAQFVSRTGQLARLG